MPKHTCRIVLDEQEYQFEKGENLLSSLIDAGVFIPHGCLSGVCCSCRLESKGQATLLACQTMINEDMELARPKPLSIDCLLSEYTFLKLSSDWIKVQALCTREVFQFQSIQWRYDDSCGDSFILAPVGNRVSFYLPNIIQEPTKPLEISWLQQKQNCFNDLSILVLASPDLKVIAHDIVHDLNLSTEFLSFVDDNIVDPSLRFKRFDKAIYIVETRLSAVNKCSVEDWLHRNYCRVQDIELLVLKA